jgi:uncharacterized membrane protein YdbT with pleckstrin-like domain
LPYPQRLLHDGEEVIVDLRPHWIGLAVPVIVTAATLGVVGAAYFGWGSAPAWFGVVLGAISTAVAVYLLGKVLSWRATLLVLTSSRVVYRTGIVRRIGREIPIDRVQDVTYVQRLLERLVGAGTLVVESAGERGTEPFPDIRHPEVLQSEINAAIDRSRRQAAAGPVDRPRTTADQLDDLADLHRRGVLTDGEFAKKKTELRDRM